MDDVEVRMLGVVRVLVGGRDAVRYRPEQQALVARLALDAGRQVAADDLAAAAWPADWPGNDLRTASRRVADELRDVLEVVRRADPSLLRLDRARDGAWTLHVGTGVLDLHRFGTARDAGLTALAAHDVPTAIDRLDEATATFRRPALEDLTGPWAAGVRDALELEALEAHVVLAGLVRQRLPDGAARAAALHARFTPQSLSRWERLVRVWLADPDPEVLALIDQEVRPALGRRLADADASAGLRDALDLVGVALDAGSTQPASSAPRTFDVRLYGSFRVVTTDHHGRHRDPRGRGGRDVTPPSARDAAVLAALVLSRGTTVPWAELSLAGWPDRDPSADPETAVAAIRAALDLSAGDGRQVRLTSTAAGAGLSLPFGWTDAGDVEALLASGTDRLTSGRTAAAVAALTTAAARCAPPALDGLAGAWFDEPRRRLQELALTVAERLAAALVDHALDLGGRPAQSVLDDLEGLAERYPRSVSLRERLMTGYAVAGRADDALGVHAAAVRELGPAFVGRDAEVMADLRADLERRRTASASRSAVRFGILDGPRMTVLGRPVLLRGRPRQRALAAFLLRRRTLVTVDDLARAAWGAPPTDAATSTARLVEDLLEAVEHATEPTWGTPGAEEAEARRSPLSVRPVPGGWVADLPPDALDLDVVAVLAEQGTAAWRRGDPAGAADGWRAVLRQVPSVPLGDLDGAWFAEERDRLAAWRASFVAPCVRAELACGRAEDALPDLTRMAAAEPGDEALAGDLMTALHAAGRTADALAAYDRCAQTLQRTLGTAPGPPLQMLRRTVLDDAGTGR